MPPQSGKEESRANSGRYQSTGYQMIRTIDLKNFRGIQHARIEGAKRINVLVGPNGTGKTALLEGIFLAAGNTPENLLKMKQFRGRDPGMVVDPRSIGAALWADTFRDPIYGKASIELTGDDAPFTRSVAITRTDHPSTIVVSSSPSSEATDIGMTFTWKSLDGSWTSSPKMTQQGLMVEPVAPASFGAHYMPARLNISEAETAMAFSRLNVDGKAGAFIDAFRAQFPWLDEVGVEAPSGSPALYAKMASGRKLPLTMISGGVSHLAGMMLRLAANPRCVLLIDEIENGFYYENYGSIWRALYNLAVCNDAQIFATSHSLECLQALSSALHDAPEDVRFIRSRLENNEVQFEQLSGPTLFKALKIGDVR
jgi:hypothetical protein